MTTFVVRDSEARAVAVGDRVLYGSPPSNRLREAVRLVRGCFHPASHLRAYHRRYFWTNLWALRESYDDYVAEVVAISDPDYDYDDELGRPVQYPPLVRVRLRDGTEESIRTTNVTRVTWADYPDGPACETFDADDLTLI